MNEFTTFDIMKILEIPRERLQDWMNRGYIVPSIQLAEGKGTKNLFSRWDLYGIALFEQVIGSGIRRSIAESCFRLWCKNTNNLPLEERHSFKCFLAQTVRIKKNQIPFSKNYPTKMSIVREHDFERLLKTQNWYSTFLFNIQNIIKEIDARI